MQLPYQLIEALDTADETEAKIAVAKLVDVGSDAVPALLNALSNRSPRIRWGAALALGRIGSSDVRIIPELIHTLSDEVEYVRKRAAESLALLGENAVPALIACLPNSEAQTQAWAAMALGQIGPTASQAGPALAELLDHENDFVRLESAAALGKIKPCDINLLIDSFYSALESKNRQLAEALLIILRETRVESDELYAAFVTAIGKISKRATEIAISCIKRIDPIFEIRENTQDYSYAIPGRILAILISRRLPNNE